jgi:hypothetical protein
MNSKLTAAVVGAFKKRCYSPKKAVAWPGATPALNLFPLPMMIAFGPPGSGT